MLSKPLYKRILVIDFETRWDRKDYTLSKMTTEQYIRDERFKAFGVCMKFLNDEEPAEWVPHDRIPDVLKTYNWNNTAVLAHNAQFDVAILSWVYGVKPCFVFDSLSMARALRGIEVGNSLAKLADEYGATAQGQRGS
jgi:DNA polymerase III epsilon subunit-like protein